MNMVTNTTTTIIIIIIATRNVTRVVTSLLLSAVSHQFLAFKLICHQFVTFIPSVLKRCQTCTSAAAWNTAQGHPVAASSAASSAPSQTTASGKDDSQRPKDEKAAAATCSACHAGIEPVTGCAGASCPTPFRFSVVLGLQTPYIVCDIGQQGE